MTQHELLTFIQRIIDYGDSRKADLNLRQLSEILSSQNADKALLDLIYHARQCIPDLKVKINQSSRELSAEDIDVAYQRVLRARMMERQGRC